MNSSIKKTNRSTLKIKMKTPRKTSLYKKKKGKSRENKVKASAIEKNNRALAKHNEVQKMEYQTVCRELHSWKLKYETCNLELQKAQANREKEKKVVEEYLQPLRTKLEEISFFTDKVNEHLNMSYTLVDNLMKIFVTSLPHLSAVEEVSENSRRSSTPRARQTPVENPRTSQTPLERVSRERQPVERRTRGRPVGRQTPTVVRSPVPGPSTGRRSAASEAPSPAPSRDEHEYLNLKVCLQRLSPEVIENYRSSGSLPSTSCTRQSIKLGNKRGKQMTQKEKAILNKKLNTVAHSRKLSLKKGLVKRLGKQKVGKKSVLKVVIKKHHANKSNSIPKKTGRSKLVKAGNNSSREKESDKGRTKPARGKPEDSRPGPSKGRGRPNKRSLPADSGNKREAKKPKDHSSERKSREQSPEQTSEEPATSKSSEKMQKSPKKTSPASLKSNKSETNDLESNNSSDETVEVPSPIHESTRISVVTPSTSQEKAQEEEPKVPPLTKDGKHSFTESTFDSNMEITFMNGEVQAPTTEHVPEAETLRSVPKTLPFDSSVDPIEETPTSTASSSIDLQTESNEAEPSSSSDSLRKAVVAVEEDTNDSEAESVGSSTDDVDTAPSTQSRSDSNNSPSENAAQQEEKDDENMEVDSSEPESSNNEPETSNEEKADTVNEVEESDGCSAENNEEENGEERTEAREKRAAAAKVPTLKEPSLIG